MLRHGRIEVVGIRNHIRIPFPKVFVDRFVFLQQLLEIGDLKRTGAIEDIEELAHIPGLVVGHQDVELLLRQLHAIHIPPPGTGNGRNILLMFL